MRDNPPRLRRIGGVMPERRDFWWKVQCDTPLNSIQLDLLERTDRYVMPCLEWAHGINNSLQLTREYKLIEFIAALEKVKEELQHQTACAAPNDLGFSRERV
jgi:hypothetical protein